MNLYHDEETQLTVQLEKESTDSYKKLSIHGGVHSPQMFGVTVSQSGKYEIAWIAADGLRLVSEGDPWHTVIMRALESWKDVSFRD